MTTRIAFLRAVNLGRRTVKMATLVEGAEGLGYERVWTHINSGNVVFDAAGSRRDLEGALEVALERAFGFEVTTFVRTATELRRTVAAAPFSVSADDTYFVTFLKALPTGVQHQALAALTNSFDTLVVAGRDVHWRMRGKSTETGLQAKDWERIIGPHQSTSRNMNMLRKLVVPGLWPPPANDALDLTRPAIVSRRGGRALEFGGTIGACRRPKVWGPGL